MAICSRCNQKIIWKQSKTGKWYAVNKDNSFHNCKNNDQQEKSDSIPSFIEAGDLSDEKNISNAKWFIEGLNLRLVRKNIVLTVTDKECSA